MPVSLNEFLMNCPPKGGRLTHTAMPGEQRGRSYTIDKSKENDFYDLYEEEVFVKKNPTHINELPDPNRRSPLKVDFDFRYLQEDPKLKPQRRYSIIMIREIVRMFYEEFKNWLVLPFDEDQTQCFVFERENAKYKNKDKDTRLIKDGIHLVWPHLVCPFSFQLKLRTEMLKKLKQSGIFTKMNLYKQTMGDIYDLDVIEGSWMMYGSCKPKHRK